LRTDCVRAAPHNLGEALQPRDVLGTERLYATDLGRALDELACHHDGAQRRGHLLRRTGETDQVDVRECVGQPDRSPHVLHRGLAPLTVETEHKGHESARIGVVRRTRLAREGGEVHRRVAHGNACRIARLARELRAHPCDAGLDDIAREAHDTGRSVHGTAGSIQIGQCFLMVDAHANLGQDA